MFRCHQVSLDRYILVYEGDLKSEDGSTREYTPGIAIVCPSRGTNQSFGHFGNAVVGNTPTQIKCVERTGTLHHHLAQ